MNVAAIIVVLKANAKSQDNAGKKVNTAGLIDSAAAETASLMAEMTNVLQETRRMMMTAMR